MGNSLLEQLKKSGLVDKNKAKQVKHSQYKSQKQKTKGGSGDKVDEAKRLAQKAHAEKVERDRRLNQQKKDALCNENPPGANPPPVFASYTP